MTLIRTFDEVEYYDWDEAAKAFRHTRKTGKQYAIPLTVENAKKYFGAVNHTFGGGNGEHLRLIVNDEVEYRPLTHDEKQRDFNNFRLWEV